MSKETWKAGTMIYPVPAVMVSCGSNEDEHNIITIAWTGTICTNPAMAYISVRKSRHSYDIIKKNMEFVINLTTKDLTYATDICGVKSGRDMDKFKELKLTPSKASKVSAPLIEESPVNIECKVTQILELGSHDMFIAEVLAVNVDDKYIDETGKFNLDKSNPICYSHGAYFDLNNKLGTFGYSVMKKKTKKKKVEDKQIKSNTYKKLSKNKNTKKKK
jgi:flavin reductase (DIM6/NTAB) family NADH-FMN oxidoreductase RutF